MYASLGANLSRYAMPSLSIADPFLVGVVPDRLAGPGSLLATKMGTSPKTFVPDWRGFALLECAGSLGL